MKTKAIITFLVVLIMCAANPAQADTVWTEGHHEINSGDVYGEIWMSNDCTLDIFGGDIYRLAAYDTTVTNWYDGKMDELWSNGDCVINIYGGILGELAAIENSSINLSAYDVVITHTGGIWDDGQVIGKYYYDDTSFIFDLWGQDSYTHVNVIPEPSTLLLSGLGSFLFIRKR